MQSSATVACRAVVMLACLIAIPVAALFGTSLPGMVKRLLDGRRPTESVAGHETVTSAPSFGLAGAVGTRDAGAAERPREEGFERPSDWPVTGSHPAGADRSRDGVPETTGVPESAAGEAAHLEAGRSDLVPVERPDWEAGSSPGGSGDRLAATSLAAATADRFTFIQQRLRRLGATYYVLEAWGDSGRLYRFHCRMAVADSANYTRYFEATDADALKAMGKVLGEVEAWRAGQASQGRAGVPGAEGGPASEM